MTNYELYVKLRREVGNTGTVYYSEARGTYGVVRCTYTPARIMTFSIDDVKDELKMNIILLGSTDGRSSKENVSPTELYLPSPMNSRYHGDMIPVRMYFELKEKGSDGFHFYQSYDVSRPIPAKEFKEMLEKQSIERLSFGFSKKDTKFDYDRIIFSGPCTIVIWKDGTKTMARVSEGDTFDPEKGVAICYMKRALGHTETNKILKIADTMQELQNSALADIDVPKVTAKPVKRAKAKKTNKKNNKRETK